MNSVPLADADRGMLYLAELFTDSAKVETPTVSVDTDGNATEPTWSTVTGMSAVACYVDPSAGGQTVGAREVQTADGRIAYVDALVYLLGRWPAVTERMRVTVGGVAYGIIAPPVVGAWTTFCRCEVVR